MIVFRMALVTALVLLLALPACAETFDVNLQANGQFQRKDLFGNVGQPCQIETYFSLHFVHNQFSYYDQQSKSYKWKWAYSAEWHGNNYYADDDGDLGPHGVFRITPGTGSGSAQYRVRVVLNEWMPEQDEITDDPYYQTVLYDGGVSVTEGVTSTVSFNNPNNIPIINTRGTLGKINFELKVTISEMGPGASYYYDKNIYGPYTDPNPSTSPSGAN